MLIRRENRPVQNHALAQLVVFQDSPSQAARHGVRGNGEGLEYPCLHIQRLLWLRVLADAVVSDGRFVAAIEVQDFGQVSDLTGPDQHGVEEPVAGELEFDELVREIELCRAGEKRRRWRWGSCSSGSGPARPPRRPETE